MPPRFFREFCILSPVKMQTFLDKTVTFRQIIRTIGYVFAVLFAIYSLLIFWNSWVMKMGGANPLNSPYRELISPECRNIKSPLLGSFEIKSPLDNLLLRRRFQRIILSNPYSDYGKASALTCLGGTIILGLHEEKMGDSNFTQEYQDLNGTPVVTISVTYHQSHPFPPIDLIKQLKDSEK